MSVTNFRNSTWTWVFWISTLVAGAVTLIAGRFPVPLPFLNERTLFVAVVEVALIFIYLFWPLLLPGSLRDGQGARDEILNVLMQIFMMMLFALPAMLAVQALSNVSSVAFVSGYALVLGSAALVGSIHVLSRSFGTDVRPHYYLALFVTQAMLPYLGYLVLEFADRDASGLVRFFSPFLSAMRSGQEPLALGQAIVFCLVAVGLGAVAHYRGRRLEQLSQA
jgi:hypothetical protein